MRIMVIIFVDLVKYYLINFKSMRWLGMDYQTYHPSPHNAIGEFIRAFTVANPADYFTGDFEFPCHFPVDSYYGKVMESEEGETYKISITRITPTCYELVMYNTKF